MITNADIIGLLNNECAEILSSLLRETTNGIVSPERFLLEISKNPDTDISKIFDYCRILPSNAISWLKKPINPYSYSHNNNKLPSLIDSASKIGLSRFRSPGVRSGFLLLAYTSMNPFTQDANTTLIHKVMPSSLVERFTEATKGSKESATPSSWVISGPAAAAATASDEWTTDLVGLARSGCLDPVIGRDKEIRQIAEILCRRRQNNACLVGEAGTGKSACVEGLAHRIASGDVPKNLRNLPIFRLDFGALSAVSGIKGEFERRINIMVETVKSSNGILFIDEIHTIVGSIIPNGMPDAANLLKPALARGELRCIGATTYPEYKLSIERDAALARRFHPITVNEPSENESILMLRGLAPALELHHDVKILDESIVDAVKMSRRYIPERRLPDKAISVLDTACVRAGSVVGSSSVVEVISEWSGVPATLISGSEDDVINKFCSFIPSPSRVFDHIKKHISLSLPPSLLLTGDDRAAKLTSVRSAAAALFGTEKSLININMSAYADPHAISSLKGSSTGYVGSIEGGFLTEAIRRRPGSVIYAMDAHLASPHVLSFFEEIIELGIVRDGVGNPIDFTNSIIVFASDNPSFSLRSENVLSVRFPSRIIA